jgi:hypothetical protein
VAAIEQMTSTQANALTQDQVELFDNDQISAWLGVIG